MRALAGLLLLAELVVYALVVGWIGLGWTLLATLATSALGAALLTRQGTRALRELRDRARVPWRVAGRALGDAGLVAVGGLLMVLPGFVGDLIGLLCLLPGTRSLVRLVLGRILLSRLPAVVRGPVRVRSTRAGQVGPHTGGATASRLVMKGEVMEGQVIEGEVVKETVIEGEVVKGTVIEGEVAGEADRA